MTQHEPADDQDATEDAEAEPPRADEHGVAKARDIDEPGAERVAENDSVGVGVARQIGAGDKPITDEPNIQTEAGDGLADGGPVGDGSVDGGPIAEIVVKGVPAATVAAGTGAAEPEPESVPQPDAEAGGQDDGSEAEAADEPAGTEPAEPESAEPEIDGAEDPAAGSESAGSESGDGAELTAAGEEAGEEEGEEEGDGQEEEARPGGFDKRPDVVNWVLVPVATLILGPAIAASITFFVAVSSTDYPGICSAAPAGNGCEATILRMAAQHTVAFLICWLLLWALPWWRGLRSYRIALAVATALILVAVPLRLIHTVHVGDSVY